MDHLEPSILYVPSHGTLESVDEFCCLNETVFGFQITIAESHQVKMRGLRVISEMFSNVKGQCLVFVTPVNGKWVSQQPLHTTESKVAERLGVVEGFAKNQYKMENALG